MYQRFMNLGYCSHFTLKKKFEHDMLIRLARTYYGRVYMLSFLTRD